MGAACPSGISTGAGENSIALSRRDARPHELPAAALMGIYNAGQSAAGWSDP